MENTGAVSPAHPVPSTPQAAYPGFQRCRGPSAPLTCLAWPAAWQSLCTGHLDASLKLSALTFTEPGPPRAEGQTARERSPFYRQRGRVRKHGSRGSISPDSGEQSRSGRERGIRTLRGGNPLPSREWGLWQKPQGGSRTPLRGDREFFFRRRVDLSQGNRGAARHYRLRASSRIFLYSSVSYWRSPQLCPNLAIDRIGRGCHDEFVAAAADQEWDID